MNSFMGGVLLARPRMGRSRANKEEEPQATSGWLALPVLVELPAEGEFGTLIVTALRSRV